MSKLNLWPKLLPWVPARLLVQLRDISWISNLLHLKHRSWWFSPEICPSPNLLCFNNGTHICAPGCTNPKMRLYPESLLPTFLQPVHQPPNLISKFIHSPLYLTLSHHYVLLDPLKWHLVSVLHLSAFNLFSIHIPTRVILQTTLY